MAGTFYLLLDGLSNQSVVQGPIDHDAADALLGWVENIAYSAHPSGWYVLGQGSFDTIAEALLAKVKAAEAAQLTLLIQYLRDEVLVATSVGDAEGESPCQPAAAATPTSTSSLTSQIHDLRGVLTSLCEAYEARVVELAEMEAAAPAVVSWKRARIRNTTKNEAARGEDGSRRGGREYAHITALVDQVKDMLEDGCAQLNSQLDVMLAALLSNLTAEQDLSTSWAPARGGATDSSGSVAAADLSTNESMDEPVDDVADATPAGVAAATAGAASAACVDGEAAGVAAGMTAIGAMVGGVFGGGVKRSAGGTAMVLPDAAADPGKSAVEMMGCMLETAVAKRVSYIIGVVEETAMEEASTAGGALSAGGSAGMGSNTAGFALGAGSGTLWGNRVDSAYPVGAAFGGPLHRPITVADAVDGGAKATVRYGVVGRRLERGSGEILAPLHGMFAFQGLLDDATTAGKSVAELLRTAGGMVEPSAPAGGKKRCRGQFRRPMLLKERGMKGAPQGDLFDVVVLQREQLEPSSDVTKELEVVRKDYVGDDWPNLFSAVTAARTLLEHHPTVFLWGLGGDEGREDEVSKLLSAVVLLVARAVSNKRSALRMNGLKCMAALLGGEHARKVGAGDMKVFVGAALACHARSSRVARDEADNAMDAAVANADLVTLLNALLTKSLVKHPQVIARAMAYVGKCLSRLGVGDVPGSGVPDGVTPKSIVLGLAIGAGSKMAAVKDAAWQSLDRCRKALGNRAFQAAINRNTDARGARNMENLISTKIRQRERGATAAARGTPRTADSGAGSSGQRIRGGGGVRGGGRGARLSEGQGRVRTARGGGRYGGATGGGGIRVVSASQSQVGGAPPAEGRASRESNSAAAATASKSVSSAEARAAGGGSRRKATGGGLAVTAARSAAPGRGSMGTAAGGGRGKASSKGRGTFPHRRKA
eukprot:g12967.t1